MKTYRLFLVLLPLLSCTKHVTLSLKEATNDVLESRVLESRATLNGNSLPVDGCNAHLLLDRPTTAPDPNPYIRVPTQATRLLMDKVIQAEIDKSGNKYWMGSKVVTIRYRETGQMTALSCGWGVTQQVKTIDLLEIRE